MRQLLLAGCVLLCSCEYVSLPQKQQDNNERIAALEKRIEDLDKWSLQAAMKQAELRAELDALAKQSKEPARTLPQPGSWIMWETQIGGPLGGGYRKPQPMLAYSAQAACAIDIDENIKRLNGEGAVYTNQTGYSFRLSCLPKGVEPR